MVRRQLAQDAGVLSIQRDAEVGRAALCCADDAISGWTRVVSNAAQERPAIDANRVSRLSFKEPARGKRSSRSCARECSDRHTEGKNRFHKSRLLKPR